MHRIRVAKKWYLWLSWDEFWYNTSSHSTTGKTPFEVVYDQHHSSVIRYLKGETMEDSIARVLVDTDERLHYTEITWHLRCLKIYFRFRKQ